MDAAYMLTEGSQARLGFWTYMSVYRFVFSDDWWVVVCGRLEFQTACFCWCVLYLVRPACALLHKVLMFFARYCDVEV